MKIKLEMPVHSLKRTAIFRQTQVISSVEDTEIIQTLFIQAVIAKLIAMCHLLTSLSYWLFSGLLPPFTANNTIQLFSSLALLYILRTSFASPYYPWFCFI